MERKFVLLILSPFQFINALEYIYANDIKFSNCDIILLSERQIATDQILKEFEEIKAFTSIHIPMQGSGNYWRRFLKTKALLRTYKDCCPIVGNLDNHWCKYMLKIAPNSISPIVVDDGTASIEILQLRNKNSYRTNRGKIINQKGFLEYIFLKPKKPLPKAITFFSCFNITPSKSDILIVNEYNYNKQKYNNKTYKLVDEIWFLGSPLLDKGFITIEARNIIFKNLKEFAKANGQQLKYFPHRTENTIDDNDFKLVKNSIPFEVYYLKSPVRPKYVISYFSTSLFVLNKMNLNTKFVAVKINSQWRKKGNWNRIDGVYNFFIKDGLAVISIDELSSI